MQLIYIEDSATDGVNLLNDLRAIIADSGLPGTFIYGDSFLTYEQYVVFLSEAYMSVALALVAVAVVILALTNSLRITIFVLMCIALVDLYLLALLSIWDVTLNSVTLINLVIAIGLAVDYSAHIAHTFS